MGLDQLPVTAQLEAFLEAMAGASNVVLTAPPGAGKSTLIPAALLGQDWCTGRILVSQPRRLAAQALAARVAAMRGSPLGAEIGYSVRFDRRVTGATRLEFLTAGLLLRRLQNDPFLSGVSAVVLDEFHERSLDTDLALALLKQVQADARPDLRIVIMSATLDAQAVATALGNTQVLHAEGRLYDVQVSYEKSDDRPMPLRAAAAASRALKRGGHVLVFLPGIGAIERCAQALQGSPSPVVPLHGRLGRAEQARALEPSDTPRVILATNIAETSLTIDGVRSVVDSGLVRRPIFEPRLDVTRLTTAAISRASADQRAGRAGRTGPGHCTRLWSRAEHQQRQAFDPPEVAVAELLPAVLQILAWGEDPLTFAWYDPPAASRVHHALKVLSWLEAIDARRQLTDIGKRMAEFPVHPRLGRMMIAGVTQGLGAMAATLAALCSEGEFLRHNPPQGVADDLTYRFEQLHAPTGAIDAHARSRIKRVAGQLKSLLGATPDKAPQGPLTAHWQPLVLAGFADRLGRRNDDGSYTLATGFSAELGRRSRSPRSELLLAITLEASELGIPRIQAALPVDPESLPRQQGDELRWDPEREAVVHERVERLGALVIKRMPAPHAADPNAVSELLYAHAHKAPQHVLRWPKPSQVLADRLRFCRHHGAGELPDPDDAPALLKTLCQGRRSVSELQRSDPGDALRQAMDHAAYAKLKAWAPERLALPSGFSARILYDGSPTAVVAAKVQHFFGLAASPILADGRATAVCHLLAPNGRPAQITRDLAGFWKGSYADVRKALRGRYPKHAWPEDPHVGQSS